MVVICCSLRVVRCLFIRSVLFVVCSESCCCLLFLVRCVLFFAVWLLYCFCCSMT